MSTIFFKKKHYFLKFHIRTEIGDKGASLIAKALEKFSSLKEVSLNLYKYTKFKGKCRVKKSIIGMESAKREQFC